MSSHPLTPATDSQIRALHGLYLQVGAKTWAAGKSKLKIEKNTVWEFSKGEAAALLDFLVKRSNERGRG